MTCSPARFAANRKNAQLSTGPKTPEGKARSRANSLKHGLCSSVVVAEDLELVRARTYEWYYTLKPQNAFQSWMVDQVALCSLRIDRAERMERRLRDRKSMLAELSWEDDARLEAEGLGSTIAGDPAQVSERLRRTPAGCDWLISRWAMLARSADVNEKWTDEQIALAFDLLGTPAELRPGLQPGESLDETGRVVATIANPAALARLEIAGLVVRRESATPLDEVDRALTEADLLDESHPELKRLRRYESQLHTRLRWSLAQFHYESPHLRPHPDLKPSWKPGTDAGPAAEATPPPGPPASAPTAPDPKLKGRPLEVWKLVPPHPPIDIEPHELPADGSAPDFPAIVASRREKKEKKAAMRREGRRRKLERLRS